MSATNSDSYTYSNAYTYTDPYSHTHTHTYSNSNSDAYTDAYGLSNDWVPGKSALRNGRYPRRSTRWPVCLL